MAMKIIRHVAFGLIFCVVAASSAWAQDSKPGGGTVFGDTGLWFVPTAETLPKGQWGGGLQLVNFDRSEGFSDITDIGGMFGFGVTDRIELFGYARHPPHRRRPGSDRAQWPATELPDQ